MASADRRFPLLPRACAVVAASLGTLPIANWISGGHGAEWYGIVRSEWLSGSAISAGLATVAFIVVRRTNLWPSGLAARIGDIASARERVTALGLGVLALFLYAVTARLILSGRPLHIDEIVQVMQARIFAGGELARPAAEYPEFFSALHVVDVGGRVFSQFPPGGPLMLLPGTLLGLTWLTGPVFGAAAVLLFWFLAREIEPRRSVALGAAMLFALAPFMTFMAASHMNHVPTLAWMLLAWWGLQRVTSSEAPSPGMAMLCGLSFGVMATIRPLDAAAVAIPAALWLTGRTMRDRKRWPELAGAGVAIAVPLLGMLFFNARTTGDPLLFGYELLWGQTHGLGFHEAPWGVTHTPARGLELINLYFLRLQTYLFETPLPGLVPVTAAMLVTPAVRGFDRYLLWSAALLVGGYFAYWHDGFFLGPRFVYLLLPVLALWTARLPSLLKERLGEHRQAERFVLLVYGVSALIALLVSVPVRVRQYASGMRSTRHDYVAPAASQGLNQALILVRESWGAQVLARLWALQVPRSEAEALYRGVDTCVLETAVSALEERGVRGAAALAVLTPLLHDSSRLVASTLSPDETERVLPGSQYSARCRQRILEDRGGYAFFTPLLARDHGGNVYARDLHARDTLLLAAYGDREVYVLRAASAAMGAPLVLVPLNVDSARADWGAVGAMTDVTEGVPAGVSAVRSPASSRFRRGAVAR